MQFDILHHQFPKLESIFFQFIHSVKNNDIEQFLQLNPQLKRFGVRQCNKLSDCIFQSIAENVPKIEEMDFQTGFRINENSIKCFGHLRELKSLSIGVTKYPQYVSTRRVILEITSANIPLKELDLFHLDFYRSSSLVIATRNFGKYCTFGRGRLQAECRQAFGIRTKRENVGEMHL